MITLDQIKTEINLVPLLEKNTPSKLSMIGTSVVSGFEMDLKSMGPWRDTIAQAMDIAKQVMDTKSFPWAGSANIKYPLISEAAINFASRIFPEIIPNDTTIVEMAMVGQDPMGAKFARSQRVSNCMSYQCASSPDWKEHIDRLLHVLPIVGMVFTKTYYDEYQQRNVSELIAPDRLVINHDSTTCLTDAPRITHVIELSLNEIVSRQRTGKFTDTIDIDCLRPQDVDPDDNDYRVELLEQHCWLDLDDDGYKEPYTVTVHEATRKVLRIVNRIRPGSIRTNKEGVYYMEAYNCFQDYHFLRSPDGGYCSIGFGQLLLPLNKAINSLINQLIDAGTVSVTQGGFLGRGLRLKGGDLRFKPFEWKVLDASSGNDIKQNIFPFPVREPSSTLLNLLTMLISMGKELTKSTEAMNGSGSATNVAASTYNGMVEQGAKIFEAIALRLYGALTSSFKKLYELNYYHLSDKDYRNILDIEEVSVKMDFDLKSNDVRPVADPKMSSMAQRMTKALALLQLRTADPRAVDAYMLETLQFDAQQIQAFLPPPDPNAPPPPEAMVAMSQAQLNQAKAAEIQNNAQLAVQKSQIDVMSTQATTQVQQAQVQESAARTWKIMKDAAHNDQKTVITASKMTQQEKLKQVVAENNRLQQEIQNLLQDKGLQIKAQDNMMKRAIELKKIQQDKEEDEGDVAYTARLKNMSKDEVRTELKRRKANAK